jgi:hypothetical protein
MPMTLRSSVLYLKIQYMYSPSSLALNLGSGLDWVLVRKAFLFIYVRNTRYAVVLLYKTRIGFARDPF